MQTQLPEKKPSKGRLIVGLLLAFVFGLPITALFPYVVYGPALAFLFAYAGFAPFLLCVVLQLFLYQALGGLPLVGMGLLASVLPAAIAARGVRWKKPFVIQLRADLIAQIAGILAAMAFAYVNYGGLIDRIMSALESSLASYPEELVNSFLAGRFDSVESLLSAVRINLILQLPGLLFAMAISSGVLMASLPNWLLRRRGEAGLEQYATLRHWRVPRQMIAGSLGLLAITLILYRTGMRGGDSVFATARILCDCCFLLQALGALARFADRANLPRGWRNVCLVLALTLLQPIAVYLGCFSALFGSRGLVSAWLREHKKRDMND